MPSARSDSSDARPDSHCQGYDRGGHRQQGGNSADRGRREAVLEGDARGMWRNTRSLRSDLVDVSQKPRFAYAESLPSERFTVDLVPALQRADRKSTPAEPSSDQSPISPEVRTPVHHMAAENVVGQASTGVDEAQPKRKRRRVAFV